MLDGKAVLVTGGAHRIGAAISRDLAAAGCHVVIHANASLAEAGALAHELDGSAVQADLADPEAAVSLVDDARDAAGRALHFVVNNASAFPRRTLAETRYADLAAMMRLHVWAPLAITRALAATGGEAAVNLLDTRISSHDPQHFPYLLSKQTLGHLTRSMARELAPFRVNGVAPGPILAPNDGSDADLEAAVEATVLGRAGTPEEVAHAVRFLLQAEDITGEVLRVDGGRHLRT